MVQHSARRCRRGAVAPMAALLLMVLVGMMAFAVDIGWVALTRSELQHAADGAALAAAGQLLDKYVLYYQANQTNQADVLSSAKKAAISAAKNYAGYNSAGGVASLELKDADIEFGFTDASGQYASEAKSSGFLNTVKVTLRRDGNANGSLPLIFARVFGSNSTDVTGLASSTIYTGDVDSFKQSGRVLPVAFDLNHWNNFRSTGLGPDGDKLTDSDGDPVLQVYPSTKYKGNFGLLSLDNKNAGASTLSGWVNDGLSASDVQSLKSSSLIPLSEHNQSNWDWSGESGMKESVVHTIEDHVGERYLLPLFKSYNSGTPNSSDYEAGAGKGGNYDYNIVQFVPVEIVSSKSGVLVKPTTWVSDPNQDILINVAPADSDTASKAKTTFTPPKLSQ